MKAQWHETDPDSGETCLYKAEFFGGHWKFKRRRGRRGEFKPIHPSYAMWQQVEDFLQRAVDRSLATEQELKRVRQHLADLAAKAAARGKPIEPPADDPADE